jgi:uroporphyrinogen III methyltransferase / synthase
LLNKFPQMKLASIGPETSKALAALGLTAEIEARLHTTEGLVQALTAAGSPGAAKIMQPQ